MDADIAAYLNDTAAWRAELERLRNILLACGLSEALKWRQPCYSINGGNVAIIGTLKDCCTIGFFKGTLLSDPEGLLEKPGENTQAARRIKFTSVAEIDEQEPVLTALIREAIDNEEQGKVVEKPANKSLDLPEELQAEFDVDPSFQKAWEKLTPGRQRAYVMHFSSAKQSATRTSRIHKVIPRIMDGYGMNDCTCGHSKRMPGCDGSHKFL